MIKPRTLPTRQHTNTNTVTSPILHGTLRRVTCMLGTGW
ncbi:predicted protein [Plenodomus lingam JN3]|uniref:Predicted protein n=1 Tax=Leptosphaeria maculans (strain JN3 / isolate v23.1.3 / race Av1-4-5-6-7-8) TaxID=985895 RepID=E5A2V6_LEPMJ|nr:predicted protein [Plenodomus lingam JN3]CBX97902.1 predicted protein [Plenodomus lingam JN3]